MTEKSRNQKSLHIAVAQVNAVAGDVAGNLAKARLALDEAHRQGADLLVFAELFLAGFTPGDLVLGESFLGACADAVATLAGCTGQGGPGIVIGFPRPDGAARRNSVAVIDGGRVIAIRDKVDLHHEESGYFSAGAMTGPVGFRGVRLGIVIGQDLSGDLDVCETLAESGADMLIVSTMSAYGGKMLDIRHQQALRRVIETDLPIVYANALGGDGQHVFDGAGFGFNADRTLAFQMTQFDEGLAICDWEDGGEGWICRQSRIEDLPGPDEADYRACLLGLRDHVEKNAVRTLVVELSGTVGSLLSAALAVDAVGAERVRMVTLSDHSAAPDLLETARTNAAAFGCRHHVVPVDTALQGIGASLAGLVPHAGPERPLEAARGAILVALADGLEAMIVGSAGRSDIATGAFGAHAGTCGAFYPIRDFFHTRVCDLLRWRNGHRTPDALGPTGALVSEHALNGILPGEGDIERILEYLIDKNLGAAEIVARGFSADEVARIERLVYRAEGKRRRVFPGVGLMWQNGRSDRRYPLNNRFNTVE